MRDEFIETTNTVDYNKNGSVQAYQSLISHIKLGKTVKVRDKNYSLYIQKFDEAIENLNNEWHVVEKNNYINKFIETSLKLYILAHESKPFNYKTFTEYLINCQLNPPQEPISKQIEKPSKPDKQDAIYNFKANWFHKFFGLVDYEQQKLDEKYKYDLNLYEEYEKAQVLYESEKQQYKESIIKYNKQKSELNEKYDDLYKKYRIGNNLDDILDYFKTTLAQCFNYNVFFSKIKFDMDYDLTDKTAIVNFRFPCDSEFPKAKRYNYIKSSKETKETLMNEKDRNELIKQTYYSLYIAVAIEIFKIDVENKIDALVLNGFYKGIDKRTGKTFEACIMTSKIEPKEFHNINFNNINPKDTFKYFSGIGTPDTSNITEVKPIRFTNKSDFKIIDSDSVLVSLSAESNLAAISWQDFETLIKDVFELEFREQDIEIKNTQHSNDGGIDVVAFNKNPYTGGVILLQAKRYTNIVTPEPVRALRGSMEQHKAIRGILVTTSDFGSSSIEFANQHNITLINGDQLIDLFKKYGYNFHIDLKQAKLLNKTNHEN